MPLDLVLETITIIVFAGLLIGAAITDVRHFLIPNQICVAIVLLFPLHVFAISSMPGNFLFMEWLASVAVALLIFAIGAGLFALGRIGGGDVKLLAATSLWAGPAGVASLLAITAIAGGMVGLIVLWRSRQIRIAGPSHQQAPEANPALKQPVPYGVAIACGGLMIAGHLMSAAISGWRV
ncbi:MAG: prepilin peptidase [Sphingomonadales bacterium]